MQQPYQKFTKLFFLLISFAFITGLTSLDYTRKVESLPNMPKGNPDLSLGIVVRPNSTGIDVLADSSQNIQFSASKNFEKTHIERLSSSSMVNHAPKKFKFIDDKYGFSSDNIYEFVITFDQNNNKWNYIRFMPFCSVIEWVSEEKLINYLNKWVKIFEEAGWKRIEYPKSDNPRHRQNFTLPTLEFNDSHQYCSWKTKDYEASIQIIARDPKKYKGYVPKAQRKNIKVSPIGYIVFIKIYKNSQYPTLQQIQKELKK